MAAHLYKKSSKWERELISSLPSRIARAHRTTSSAVSISLSKQDKLFKDAIETAATSGSSEVAEELLTYFVYVCRSPCRWRMLTRSLHSDIGSRECYTATRALHFAFASLVESS